METITETKPYIYEAKGLEKEVQKTIEKIQDYVKDNDYQVEGDISSLIKKGLFSSKLRIAIGNASKSKKKKLNKRIRKVNKRMTLRGVNLFFNFVLKKILESKEKIKVLLSIKEITIQDKRKKWKEARDISEKLLSEYKEEKGDFYK